MLLSRWRYYLRSIPTLLWNITPRQRVLAVFLGVPTRAPFAITLRNGLRFVVRSALDIWIIKENCLDETYQHGLPPLPATPVIIDIGAGLGDFSIFAARQRPHGVVYAYEPDAGSFALLQANCPRNRCSNIHMYPLAVTGHGQPVTIDRQFAHPVSYQTVAASRAAPDEPSVCSTTLNDVFADHDLQRCDLLKIDCEGAEYAILLHARPDILARVRMIALEYHHDQGSVQYRALVAFLEQEQFRVRCVPSPVYHDRGVLYAENMRAITAYV